MVVGVVSGPDDAVDEDKLREVIFTHHVTYPQVRDRDLALTRLFDVKGTPTIVVLDAHGELAYNAHHLPTDWNALLDG